jgi:uncharacterized delta-60 repeat protein
MNNRIVRTRTLCACCFLPFSWLLQLCLADAQYVTNEWVARFASASTNSAVFSSLSVDKNGNYFAVGSAAASDFYQPTSSGVLVMKFNSAGIPLWTNRFHGPNQGGAGANSLAIDGSGDVYVAGYVEGAGGLTEFLALKFNGTTGLAVWTNRYRFQDIFSDEAKVVAVDNAGNVFVTGNSWSASGSEDIVTLKIRAADGGAVWTNRYNGPSNSSDYAAAMTSDAQGNVLVSGYSWSGEDDFLVFKISSASGAVLWTNRYNGPGNGSDRAQAMAVDGTGNVYVTGYSDAGSGNLDYATLKINGTTGMTLWTNRFNGSANGFDAPYAIGLDGSGNAIVTGESSSATTFTDFATLKIDGNTGAGIWTNVYNGGYEDGAYAMAVDSAGNAFVAGYKNDVIQNDITTLKIDGTTGTVIWTNVFGGRSGGADGASAVALGTPGNVIVSGFSEQVGHQKAAIILTYDGSGTALRTNAILGEWLLTGSDQCAAMALDNAGNIILAGTSWTAQGWLDYSVVKYSPAGLILWTNIYDGYGWAETLRAMAVDNAGNVYVTGSSPNANNWDECVTLKINGATGRTVWTNRASGIHGGGNAVCLDGGGNVCVTGFISQFGGPNDVLTLKIDPASGATIWTNIFSGLGNGEDGGTSLAIDSAGNVLVAGYSVNAPGASPDFLTLKISGATGAAIWTNSLDGPAHGDDRAVAVRVDANNDVLVTGYSPGIGTADDYLTLKINGGTGNLMWTNRFPGSSTVQERPTALAVDSAGNVYVTGQYGWGGYDTLKINGASGAGMWTNSVLGSPYASASTLDSAGDVYIVGGKGAYQACDYQVVKISGASGTNVWSTSYNGPANLEDFATTVAVDNFGTVYVAGTSVGLGTRQDFALIRLSQRRPPVFTQVSSPSAGILRMNFLGDPSLTYGVERSTNGFGNWTRVGTVLSEVDGTGVLLQPIGPSPKLSLYRLVYP